MRIRKGFNIRKRFWKWLREQKKATGRKQAYIIHDLFRKYRDTDFWKKRITLKDEIINRSTAFPPEILTEIEGWIKELEKRGVYLNFSMVVNKLIAMEFGLLEDTKEEVPGKRSWSFRLTRGSDEALRTRAEREKRKVSHILEELVMHLKWDEFREYVDDHYQELMDGLHTGNPDSIVKFNYFSYDFLKKVSQFVSRYEEETGRRLYKSVVPEVAIRLHLKT